MLTIAQALDTLGPQTTQDIIDKANSEQELRDELDQLEQLMSDNQV